MAGLAEVEHRVDQGSAAQGVPSESAEDHLFVLSRDFAGAAAREWERAQELAKRAQAADRLAGGIFTELQAGRPGEAMRIIRTGIKQVEALRDPCPEQAGALEKLREGLESRLEDVLAALPREFPEAMGAAGLQLDATSRHPRYTLLDGLLTVEFDKKALEVRVVPRDGRKIVLGVDIWAVVDHLRAEATRLGGRAFDPGAFAERLRAAYVAVLQGNGGQSGDAAPIKEVVAQLAKDKTFRPDEFNVDLSRLVRSEAAAASQLRLDHSRDPKHGLLLWQLDQRGYYGYLRMGGMPS